MAKRKKLSKKVLIALVPLALCALIVLSVALLLILPFSPHVNHSVQSRIVHQPTDIPLPTATPTPPTFPDFSQSNAQPRNTFDLSTWEQFDDSQVGLRFKYPPNWGTPKIERSNGSWSGWLYLVTFPKSFFRVGGETSNYSSGREGSIFDFMGFSSTQLGFTHANPDTYCSTREHLLFCQTQQNKIDLLSGANCEPMPWIPPFMRIVLINRPGKEIGGLVFGGGFLSSEYGSNTWGWFCTSDFTLIPTTSSNFNNVIIQRRLDSKSMKTFDEYEKVFETIENY